MNDFEVDNDVEMKCKDCGQPFTIPGREIEWYKTKVDEKGEAFTLPKRCKPCRVLKRKKFEGFSEK